MQRFLNQYDLPLRVVVLVLALISLMVVFAATNAALAAGLRGQVIEVDHSLTVGDLFEGAGLHADYVLGPAPKAGDDMVIDANTLGLISRTYNIGWAPDSDADYVRVKRASNFVSAKQVKHLISTALRDQDIMERFELSLDGESENGVEFPKGTDTDFDVVNLDYDRHARRFTATLRTKDDIKRAVTGTLETLVAVPVLKERRRQGEIIDAYDVDFIDMRESALQSDFILNADAIVGMTPRRQILSDVPLKVRELVAPQIIDRGDTVTMIIKTGGMTLTSQGKATQAGAKGEVIRVINERSNRALEAVIYGERTVMVKQKG